MATLESQYSNQATGLVAADVLAPGQVTGLSHTVQQGGVILTWAAVTTNADGSDLTDLGGYRIYRKDNADGVFALLASVGADEVTFTDTAAKAGATFLYAVSAIDSQEVPNEGVKSADYEAKTIPSVPTGLVTSATQTAINLNWTSVKDKADAKLNENLAGYNVYRSETDGTGYAKVGNAAVEATTYEDNTAVVGTTYYYVITAFDNSL